MPNSDTWDGFVYPYLKLMSDSYITSRVIRKQTFCICGNTDADQLRVNREADQRLCFRYIDSTIPLLPKTEISSLKQTSVTVQLDLCRTRSETRALVFSSRGSYHYGFCLQVLKMYAWEPSFMKKVQTIRNMEISKLWSYAILTAINIVFAIHSPFIVRKLQYLVLKKPGVSTTCMFGIDLRVINLRKLEYTVRFRVYNYLRHDFYFWTDSVLLFRCLCRPNSIQDSVRLSIIQHEIAYM